MASSPCPPARGRPARARLARLRRPAGPALGAPSRPRHAAAPAHAARSGGATPDLLLAEGLGWWPAGAGSPVLSGASISLPARGLHMLVGKSGCGKSSLLMCLSGLAAPTAGAVRFCDGSGSPGAEPAGCAELLSRVGLVFQFPERHFLASTAAEELTFGWPRQGPGAAAARRERAAGLEAALGQVGLGSLPLDAAVRELSGGYQRRLALALQLARSPDVLLLDEPLAGLDWRARDSLCATLGELKERRCVLVVTHDTRELASVADRVWRMSPGGACRDEGPPSRGALGSSGALAA